MNASLVSVSLLPELCGSKSVGKYRYIPLDVAPAVVKIFVNGLRLRDSVVLPQMLSHATIPMPTLKYETT